MGIKPFNPKPMQIPGGLLAKRFGGRDVLAFSTALAATFTLLTPASASIGLPYLVAPKPLTINPEP